MSDSDKQLLTKKEYNKLEASKREVLDTAMAHSREIFGIQVISDVHTSQVPENKQVDGKAVLSKNRQLAAEAHPDKHVPFCKKYNIDDSAGILKDALKKAVQTMQNAKDLVLCWLAIGGNGIFVDKVADQNMITVEIDRHLYGNFGLSELPVRKLVLQLYVSEMRWKSLGVQHKTLHFGFHLPHFIL
jgi:hypothetical protein